MKIIYRYMRPMVFDENICEVIPSSKGGIAFRFDIVEEFPQTLLYTYARCMDNELFNYKICHNILDGRMCVDRYTNSIVLDYNSTEKFIDILYEKIELEDFIISSEIYLKKHMDRIIKHNKTVNDRVTHIVNNLSNRILDNIKTESDENGRFYIDSRKF